MDHIDKSAVVRCLTDPTWWLYFYGLVVSLAGFIAFAYDGLMVRNKSRSAEYFYVTIMLCGFTIVMFWNTFARYLRFHDLDEFNVFLGSWMWPFRWIVVSIALTAIVGHSIYKLTIRTIAEKQLRKNK